MDLTPETTAPKPKNRKGKWVLLILTAVLLIGGSIGYTQYQEKQEQAEAKRKAVEKEKKAAKERKLKKYGEDLDVAASSMIIWAATAEEMNDQYYSVWHDAIYEDKVVIDGETAYDFNDALQLQYDLFESEGKLGELQGGIMFTKNFMTDLKNPPEKYEDAYEALVEMYKPFQKYTALAESPDGSLQSFSETTNQLVSEINAAKEEFDIKLP